MEWINIILRFDVSKRLPFMLLCVQSEVNKCTQTRSSLSAGHWISIVLKHRSVCYTRYVFNGRRNRKFPMQSLAASLGGDCNKQTTDNNLATQTFATNYNKLLNLITAGQSKADLAQFLTEFLWNKKKLYAKHIFRWTKNKNNKHSHRYTLLNLIHSGVGLQNVSACCK